MSEPLQIESSQALIGGRGWGYDQSVRKRFWSKVLKHEGGGCWEWQGTLGTDGYGRISTGSPSVGDFRMRITHRLSWEMAYGVVEEGLFVLHRCDNRLCVRPDHLFLGTHQDNMDDMVSKGRSCPGSHNGASVLSEADAIEITRRFCGGESQSCLAEEFGVTRAAIGYLVNGKSWSHVGPCRKSLTREEVAGRALGGEQHPRAKLDQTKVDEIRARYAAGGVTQKVLAVEFGVTQGTIWKIVRRKLWG